MGCVVLCSPLHCNVVHYVLHSLYVDNSPEIVFDFSTEAQVDVFSRNRNNLNKTWIICDNMNAYVAQMESSKSSKSSKANLTCWYFLFFQNIIHWWKQRFLNIFAKFEKFLNKTWTICDRKMSILQRKKAPEQKTANQSILFLEGGGEGGSRKCFPHILHEWQNVWNFA